MDIFIENPGICSIVVEVKVGAPENGPQIREYRDWLSRTKSGECYVFSLVQRPNPSFQIQQFGGECRITWLELYACFSERKRQNAHPVEGNLIEHFGRYLEAESIVSFWKPGLSLATQEAEDKHNALEAAFEQVSAQLRDNDENCETKINIKNEPWPRLEVSKKGWDAIFGSVGSLRKVYLYYQGKNMDGWGMNRPPEDRFYLTVLVWSRWHQCDWEIATRKLPSWLSFFRQQGFKDWFLVNRKSLQQNDALIRTFHEPPDRVNAEHRTLAIFTAQVFSTLSSAEIVNELVKRVNAYCEVVSQLR